MAISNEFKEAVQSGKLLRVRIMLKDSLLVDPTAAQFDEMQNYATEKMGNIYVEHDGEKLNYDVNCWNENYLNKQLVAVVNSFSKERIQLLKSMVRYLYKDRVNKIQADKEKETTQEHVTVTRKQVGTGVTVVGAAIAVAGICTSQTALAVGGVVVAAAGVALVISDKRDV